jgi:hypothetical protein
MPHAHEFLTVDEAVRILEDSGYKVHRSNRLYYVVDPYGSEVWFSVCGVRALARSLWVSVGVLRNLARSGLTVQHPGGTILP